MYSQTRNAIDGIMCDMTDDLYERYKEALKTGHVAVLRGSLESAIGAYKQAAEIAPTRALPHTSLGTVYMRLGRPEDALDEFTAAVSRAPHDEGALLGQAEALTSAGRRGEAAAALDHVAEIQEASGRLPEAADTLRRAIELEEAPDRIRQQRAFLREIRFAAGDQVAEQLLARALRLRDEPAPEGTAAADVAPANAETAAPIESEWTPGAELMPEAAPVEFEPVLAQVAVEPVEAEPPAQPVEPGPADAFAASPAESLFSPIDREPQELNPEQTAPVQAEPLLTTTLVATQPAEESEERPAVGVMSDFEGRETAAVTPGLPTVPLGEREPDGDELLAAAEMADGSGDSEELHALLLKTGRAYAQEGRYEAALDATHRLLSRAPGDVDAHLLLVELYVARSWDGLAVEKLRLLGRLADLNDDAATRRRLCEVATATFPKDPSLEKLCS